MLWGLTFPFCFGLALFTAWAFSGKAEDLRQNLSYQGSPRGPWIILRGSAHTHSITKAFLVNSQTGQSIQLPLGLSTVTFSEDGRRAVWLDDETQKEQIPSRLIFLDLENPSGEPKETPLVLSLADPLALSPSGRQIANLDGKRITVYEINSGRIRKSVDFPFSPHSEAVFVGEDQVRIRLFPLPEAKVEGAIFRWNLSDGSLVQTGIQPDLAFMSDCLSPTDETCLSIGISNKSGGEH